MTGFATREGAAPGLRWNWEIRGVNARGLDIRLRLPDAPEVAEALGLPEELYNRPHFAGPALAKRVSGEGSRERGEPQNHQHVEDVAADHVAERDTLAARERRLDAHRDFGRRRAERHHG